MVDTPSEENLRPQERLQFGLGTVLLVQAIFDVTTRRQSGFFAGVLIVGCFIASVIGTLMLPLSLFGLLFVIGVLGFTPFLTAYAFGRNALRAFPLRLAEHGQRPFAAFLVASGITFAISVPLVINWAFGDQLNELLQQVSFSRSWNSFSIFP